MVPSGMDGVFSIGNIAALVAVAGLWVLLRAAFGRRDGHEPRPEEASFAPVASPRGAAAARAAPEPAAEGVAALRATGDFDEGAFLVGARAAFAQIVEALSEGRRADWRALTSAEVDEAFAAAPAPASPVRVLSVDARIARARLDRGGWARVEADFASEQRDGDGVVRRARDAWTFERRLGADDPNWRVCGIV